MRRAQVAVAVGFILLLLGFAAGTGAWDVSASVNGKSITCGGPVIDLNRLPFNELGSGPEASGRKHTPYARRVQHACQDATLPLRLLTWSSLVLGTLVGLAGWTALRERQQPPAPAAGRLRPS